MTFTGQRAMERQAVPEALRVQWAENDLVPLWESTNSDFRAGSERARLWRWSKLRPVLLETVKIALPSIVERRVLQLVNRSIDVAGADATTGLMNATIQGLMPGELARPHRHSMNALRFVLEGSGAVTTIDGKPSRMEPADLIITPGMTWHEHHHDGDAPTFWLDVLDVYLHRLLGTASFQPGPIPEPRAAYDDAAFSTPNIVPVVADALGSTDSPVFRYPWSDVLKALAHAPVQIDGTRVVRYVNPLTGGSCMSLIDCYVAELLEGESTHHFRTTASAVVSVVSGAGVSQIGSERLEWSAKDTFTMPAGAVVSHRAIDAPARIFVATNREVYRRLGLLSESRVETSQI